MALSLIWCPGCYAPGLELHANEEIAARESAIVNGSLDYGHPTVGRLLTNTSCSATLVGYRTVLTAAHCLKGADIQAVFFLGDDPYGYDNPAYDVIEHHVHPDYRPEVKQHDIGLVVLDRSPPVRPSTLADTRLDIGSQVTLVGFGSTDDDAADGGFKRSGQTRILWRWTSTYGFFTTFGSWANTCYGDSGGPTFAVQGGRPVVAGVHSYHWVGCDTSGFDMRVDAYLPWLMEASGGDIFTPTHEPPPPPAADLGLPDAGGPAYTDWGAVPQNASVSAPDSGVAMETTDNRGRASISPPSSEAIRGGCSLVGAEPSALWILGLLFAARLKQLEMVFVQRSAPALK